jgi:ribosomal protein S18 acetylase RimI-like enzyme
VCSSPGTRCAGSSVPAVDDEPTGRVTGTVIGEATDEEAAALLELSVRDYVGSLRERRGLSAGEADAKAQADTRRFLPEGPRTPGAVFVAARGGDRLLGGVWAAVQGPDRAGEAWIFFLWVDPSVRRQGLARRLVEATATRVREQGATDLALNVFGDNTGAIALYESLGFGVVTQQMSRSLTHG